MADTGSRVRIGVWVCGELGDAGLGDARNPWLDAVMQHDNGVLGDARPR